ncbi:hypothetical protein FRZ61_03040 [Hypericibacter adhaerens]|uniref:Uncharacterized protein n=1 Tax=Hypericibacter adhaerens TaxID=2602016 RepID=A0A5J6MTD2_9PROT|nr:hypothetical protein [Hypericibacter adhaerens]QEX20387.1 hypothetical protein FRZ61_03040 [Hypericibacter adhaerens]
MYQSPIGWHAGGCQNWSGPYYLALILPVPCMPSDCKPCSELVVPREIEVDAASSPQQGFVGGHGETHLTLEYLVDAGAAAPAVEIKLETGGTTQTWSATDLAEGYHVEDGFLAAEAGTKVSISVTDALARLRWCERICC